MRVAQLGAAVAAASASHAFLLPPTISKADTDVVAALPIQDAVIATDGQVMEIPCPGCPVDITDIRGQVVAVTSHIENVLRFNISLAHNEADQLMLNGIQLYPVEPQSNTFGAILSADQLVKTSEGTWAYAATPELGYFLSIAHPSTSTDEDKIGLVALSLEIIEVGGKPVTIPTIDLNLLETPSGKLMIGNSQISPARVTVRPSDLPVAAQKCTTVLCKWKAIIAGKLSKAKGCGKPRPSEPRPATKVDFAPAVKPGHGHHIRPHSHGHHGPHRHRRHGSFARIVRGLIFHIFIPILIGIVMGITASLVGMIVGHLAIFVWRTVFRRNQRVEYQKVHKDDTDGKEDSKSLMEHQSPPPVYEDAPSYEEAVVNEKESQ